MICNIFLASFASFGLCNLTQDECATLLKQSPSALTLVQNTHTPHTMDQHHMHESKRITRSSKIQKNEDAHQHHTSKVTRIVRAPNMQEDEKVEKKDTHATSAKQLPTPSSYEYGLVTMPGVPPLGFERDGDVKVFRLTAAPFEHELVDTAHNLLDPIIPEQNKYHDMHMPHIKKTIRVWGFNKSIPGPVIEAVEGDRVRIIFTNNLPEPSSIHWHGIELPNAQDGAAGETEPPTMPGDTRVYEFTVYRPGTFMYHSGFNVMKQDHKGMFGAFVVHPKKYEEPVDKHFVIMLQQWSILPGNDTLDLVSNDFNWFTFNGKVGPNIPPLEVKQHERVRIHFANIGMDAHPIHMHGYVWEEVGTEGGPIPKSARRKGSTINVPAGTTRDVEFVAWNPGLWRLHCHKLHHIVNAHADVPMHVMPHGGMFTLLHVVPKDPHAEWSYPAEEVTA